MQVNLYRDYLRYDIEAITSRYANARVKDPELRDEASQDDSASSRALTDRLISSGVAMALTMLSDHVSEVGNEAVDNKPRKNTSICVETLHDMKVSGKVLASLLHWVVVRYAVYSFLQTYAPNEAYAEKRHYEDLLLIAKSKLRTSPMPMKEKSEGFCGEDVYEYTRDEIMSEDLFYKFDYDTDAEH